MIADMVRVFFFCKDLKFENTMVDFLIISSPKNDFLPHHLPSFHKASV